MISTRVNHHEKILVSSMNINEFVPFVPRVFEPGKRAKSGTTNEAPLCLGNSISCSRLAVTVGSKVYNVPTQCNTKNYRRPCGLGATLVCKNVVLETLICVGSLVSQKM